MVLYAGGWSQNKEGTDGMYVSKRLRPYPTLDVSTKRVICARPPFRNISCPLQRLFQDHPFFGRSTFFRHPGAISDHGVFLEKRGPFSSSDLIENSWHPSWQLLSGGREIFESPFLSGAQRKALTRHQPGYPQQKTPRTAVCCFSVLLQTFSWYLLWAFPQVKLKIHLAPPQRQ
jgi:hypothetical protein